MSCPEYDLFMTASKAVEEKERSIGLACIRRGMKMSAERDALLKLTNCTRVIDTWLPTKFIAQVDKQHFPSFGGGDMYAEVLMVYLFQRHYLTRGQFAHDVGFFALCYPGVTSKHIEDLTDHLVDFEVAWRNLPLHFIKQIFDHHSVKGDYSRFNVAK